MVGDAGEFLLGGVNTNNPSYRQFFRLGDIPRPAGIFTILEEHPDSINDGYFLNRYHGYRWIDLPASHHSGGANFAFADGHVEMRRWVHPTTKPAPRPGAADLPFEVAQGGGADFRWVMERMSVEAVPDEHDY
jgi:prepilin-type processing-associated H-X9-DG protein